MEILKKGTRAVVQGCKLSNAPFNGSEGTVMTVSQRTNSYGVLLDNKLNTFRKDGFFWFKLEELRVLDEKFSDQTDEKEEVKIMQNETIRTKEIVTLYFKNKGNLIKRTESEKIDELTKEPELLSECKGQICDIVHKFLEKRGIELTELEFNHSIQPRMNSLILELSEQKSEEIQDKINKITNETNRSIRAFLAEKNEVETMLTACDSYDKEMDVLRAYNIVDQDGKLCSSTDNNEDNEDEK